MHILVIPYLDIFCLTYCVDWYDNTGVGARGIDDVTEDLEEEDDQTLDDLLQFSTSSLPE